MPPFRLPETHASQREVVLPAIAIVRFGFGTEKLSRYVNGIYRTEDVRRLFRMACGHVIGREGDLGKPCVHCLAEFEAVMQVASVNGDTIQLSPDEVNYACSSCAADTFQCSVQYCCRPICRRHAAILPTGEVLCQEHFLAFDLETRMVEQGPLTYRVKEFVKGLFHLGDP